ELISDTGIDGASLTWRVYAYLKDDAFVRTYPRLVQATSSMSDTSRFSLAERIARVLLTYNAFRNDWVIAWLKGEDPKCEEKILTDPDYAWQKAMWQKIGQDLKLPLEHPARRLRQTPEAFRETSELHVLMPQNVAPFYLEFLAELSRVRDITIYVINPSEIYWFDLNRKTVIEEGSHPILSKWAAQRKALNQLLIDFTYAQNREDVSLEQVPFRKEEPFGKEPSNLEWLQHSIFKGNAKLFENFHEPRRVVDGSPVYDRSLEIHGAYSLKREIEAFVDYLYDIFQNDETLKASDVLVLTPALEKAAPLFESVFTNLPEKRKIAWRVVGRSETARNELVTTLFQLFETILGGFGVREVYALFSAVPVAARFRFTNETLDKMRNLFEEAGFHQSLNREELAQKSFYNGKRFTLEAALNRVMLRYVMREDFDDVVGDIRPEGRRIDKEPLAALYRAFEVLTDLFEVSTQKRTLSEWVTRFLQNAIANFMQGRSEDEIRVNEVADLIMKECEAGEAHNLAIDFSTFVAIFKNKFKAYTFGAKPVPSVTLTNLANMRGLPYRVIAVIGLNDGVFPRRTEAESFDLCLAAPKAGDRQRNADDKNVFFDVLTATRDHLYLSYTSRDMANGTRLQPSSLIRELLECLTNQNATTKDDWLIEHPIQAFSAANFYRGEAFEENDVDIRKISFDTELADDINVCQGKPAVFNIVEEAQSEEIALSDVLDFWDNPLKYFWKRRLGLNMARDDSSFTNDEPLILSELDKWKMNTDIFDELMESGQNGKASDKSRLLAASIVPSGKLGEKAVDDLCSKVEAFAALCRTDLEKGPS
ncbi:MAG TPA: hypothetical protein DCW60_00940, partial [Sutterella sp.]|nr:hypothetical protein [Sutterella sp.]